MRFESITLERYGAYADRVLRFRDGAALHLIYGPNEAGKSTALEATADLLFGFKGNSTAGFRYDNKSLRIGANIRLQNGEKLEFWRRKGTKNTLVDANQGALGDDFLDRVTGALSRETFLSEFGLNAAALRAGGEALLAAQGNLAETLAAGSAGLFALNRLRQSIEADAAELFTKRRFPSKKFYVALEQYTHARERLNKAVVTGVALERAQAEREAASEKHRTATEAHGQSARTLARLKRTRATMGKLRQLAQLEHALAALDDAPEISAEDLKGWSAALEQAAALALQIEATQASLHELQMRKQALQIEPALIAQARDIESLREWLGAVRKDQADLPKRMEARRGFEADLAHAAQQFGLDAASLEERLPGELTMAKARDALRRRTTLDDRIAQLRERLAAARKNHADLAAAQPEAAAQDPGEIAQEFLGFSGVRDDANALRRHAAEIRTALAALERQCARLDPPAGDLDTIVALPLPDPSAVAQAATDWKSLSERKRAAAAALADLQARDRNMEATLAELDRAGAVATDEDWRAARDLRDALLARISSETQPSALPGLLLDLRKQIEDADRLAQALIGNADRAGQKQALLRDRDLLHRQIESAGAQAQTLAAEIRSAGEAWTALWARSGIAPHAPDRMSSWLSEIAKIVADHGLLEQKRMEYAALEMKMRRNRTALESFMERLQLRPDPAASIEQLHDFAGEVLHEKQKAHTAARVQAEGLRGAQRQIEHDAADLARLLGEAEDMQAAWRDILRSLSLPADAGAAELSRGLDLWAKAQQDSEKYAEFDHRVKAIEQDIARFESHVGALAKQFALGEEAPERLVEALTQRLQSARRAADEDVRLTQEIEKARADLKTRQDESARLQNLLDAAAGCCGIERDRLPATMERISARLTTLTDIAALRRDIALASDGLDIETLKAEQAGLEFDELPGAIALAEAAQARFIDEAKAAAIAESEAAKAFDTLCLGHDAAALAQEKVEAAAELQDIARNWLLRAAAAKLAALAIEKHRQTEQDPVLAAISVLFAQATGGAFSGLALDYDERDQPIFKAVRGQGEERVGVAALSEGTRDQLFLALRLALLQQRHAEPLPFIGDDLLASFDDARTGHALEMLATFGAGQQAVLFTHHRHVVDIANKCLGGRLDLIALGP